jgi:WD40 repeat protein
VLQSELSHSHIAGSYWLQTIRLWNPITGGYLQELKELRHPVYAVAFSPDGAFPASASGDFTMILCTEEAEEGLRMTIPI